MKDTLSLQAAGWSGGIGKVAGGMVGGQWTLQRQKQGLSSGLGQETYLGNQALQAVEDSGWEFVPESLGEQGSPSRYPSLCLPNVQTFRSTNLKK